MLKFSFGLLCALYLVSQSLALFSREKVTDYCEYWQFSPLYEELDLDHKCLKSVYVNPNMVSFFTFLQKAINLFSFLYFFPLHLMSMVQDNWPWEKKCSFWKKRRGWKKEKTFNLLKRL